MVDGSVYKTTCASSTDPIDETAHVQRYDAEEPKATRRGSGRAQAFFRLELFLHVLDACLSAVVFVVAALVPEKVFAERYSPGVCISRLV